ncbi:hypothetical protein ACWD5R_37575 [Streptomyces sp. NPDC002514]|uniref:hypothetical protein n=1 Tax=unclassified Streptomyces TaxID=2593676 RepID=UPI003684B5AA
MAAAGEAAGADGRQVVSRDPSALFDHPARDQHGVGVLVVGEGDGRRQVVHRQQVRPVGVDDVCVRYGEVFTDGHDRAVLHQHVAAREFTDPGATVQTMPPC